MSMFRRLMKESGRFYLFVLVFVLSIVICDSLLVCREAGVRFTRTGVEKQLQEMQQRAEQGGISFQLSQQKIDLSDSICDKADNYSIIGFWITIVGIVFVLMMKKICYMDIGTEEFRRTLPIRERCMVMFDYICMFVIIVIGALVHGTILIAGQTCYYGNLNAVAPKYIEGKLSDSTLVYANQHVLFYLMCYVLFILLVYTWIYFFMTIARNPVLGVGASLLSWFGLYLLFDNALGRILMNYNYDVACGIVTSEKDFIMIDKINALRDFIDSFFSPSFFFNYYIENSSYLTGNTGGYNIGLSVATIIVALLMGILFLVFLGGKRELTKGLLFYYPVLNYPFALLCGVLAASFVDSMMLWSLPGIIYMIIGFCVAVIIWSLIHPFSKRKSVKWEVK